MKTLEEKNSRMNARGVLVLVLVLLSVQVYSTEAISNTRLSAKVDSTLSNVITASVDIDFVPYTDYVGVYTNTRIVRNYSLNSLLAEEMEQEIALEDWMLSTENTYWSDFKVDGEDEIQLEAWMMDASIW